MQKKFLNKDTLKQFISDNRLNEVVKNLIFQLNEFLDKNKDDIDYEPIRKLSDALIINSGKLNGLEHDKIIGILEREAQRIITAEVQNAVLYIIDQLPIQFWNYRNTTNILSYKSQLLEGVELLHQQQTQFEYDLFICFSTKDREFAKSVWETLRGYGLRVFVSDEDLQSTVGFSFLDKIDFALSGSQHLVLLASSNALNSVYVRDEYQAFYNDCHVKNPNLRLLIVFKLDNFQISELPRILRNKQIATNPEQIVLTLVKENLVKQENLNKQQEEERIAKEQAELKRKQEDERIAKEQAELKHKQEEERIAKEQAELKHKQEEERIAKEQAELKRKQKEERIVKEQAVLKSKQEEERIVKEQAVLKSKQEEERIAKEQAELKRKQEEERIVKEQAELKRKQEEERIVNEQTELKHKQEEEGITKEQAELKHRQEEKQIDKEVFIGEQKPFENRKVELSDKSKLFSIIRKKAIYIPVSLILTIIFIILIVKLINNKPDIGNSEIIDTSNYDTTLFNRNIYPSNLTVSLLNIDFDLQDDNIPDFVNYIKKRNSLLKRLGDSLGIEFTILPIPTNQNVLTKENAIKYLITYKNEYLAKGNFSIFNEFGNSFNYYTKQGMDYVYLNANSSDLHYFGDELVYIQPYIASLFAKPNQFLAFNDIEILTDSVAHIFGKHENNSIYMYDLKFVSYKHARNLFHHKDGLKIMDLSHIDSLTAEIIAKNNCTNIDFGKKFDDNEKLIWVRACYRNNWSISLGSNPTLTKQEAINQCIKELQPKLDYIIPKLNELKTQNLEEKELLRQRSILLHGIVKDFDMFFEKHLIYNNSNSFDSRDICSKIIWNSDENRK